LIDLYILIDLLNGLLIDWMTDGLVCID